MDDLDSRIHASILITYLRTGIITAIINQDDFNILKRLLNQAINALTQILLNPENRD